MKCLLYSKVFRQILFFSKQRFLALMLAMEEQDLLWFFVWRSTQEFFLVPFWKKFALLYGSLSILFFTKQRFLALILNMEEIGLLWPLLTRYSRILSSFFLNEDCMIWLLYSKGARQFLFARKQT